MYTLQNLTKLLANTPQVHIIFADFKVQNQCDVGEILRQTRPPAERLICVLHFIKEEIKEKLHQQFLQNYISTWHFVRLGKSEDDTTL